MSNIYHRAAYAILSDSLARAVLAAERVVCVTARASDGAWVLLAAALRNFARIDVARVDGDRLAAPNQGDEAAVFDLDSQRRLDVQAVGEV